MTFSLGRLEYNAANQNPVLDYIISVEELPARLVYKILKNEFLYFFPVRLFMSMPVQTRGFLSLGSELC